MRTADRIGISSSDGDACQCAARAGGRTEGVDLAIRIAPDFRSGRLEMRMAIGGIVELIGPDGAG
jgi:hypothetical protein